MSFKPEDNIMEMIWVEMPRFPDENHVTLTPEALDEVWENGFVDTDRYSMEDWRKAFGPHKTPDGNYTLKKEDFLEKDKYRYRGEIMIPFEPLLINEGKYTDEGLEELIDLSITPSCSRSRRELREFFEELKEKFREPDGLIRMSMDGKRKIAELIYKNPSPTRKRELLFDAMFTMHMREIAYGTSPLLKATPVQAAQVQVSTFTTAPTCQAEIAAKGLKNIEKTKPKVTGSGNEGMTLRKVKKSRKGMRG